ncbi:MAG: hypothetical protein JWM21_2367 [Acidobacteria bacterium]|nr:hypothetical protein [Acidobacteriota bacterium]
MLLKTFLILATGVVLAAAAYGVTATSMQHAATEPADAISGDWDLSFEVEGTTTPATFNLKLDGEKITGKVYSAHTGPGTINGSWTHNKLSATLTFASHESIALTGELNEGRITGEFRTEGFVSKWQAKRKSATETSAGPATVTTPVVDSADPISGEWVASLQTQGTGVPVTFKFKLDGENVTGASESEHLGSGALNDGSWKAGKLSFTMTGKFGVVALTGALHDGKLAGEWSLTGKDMKGTWEAKRK